MTKRISLFFTFFLLLVAMTAIPSLAATELSETAETALSEKGIDVAAKTADLSLAEIETLYGFLNAADLSDVTEDRFDDFVLASQAITYRGLRARVAGTVPGIRSTYAIHQDAIDALSLRYRVVYGALMGIGELNGTRLTMSDLTVNDSFAATSALSAAVTVYDSIGGTASNLYTGIDENGDVNFAYTTTYKGKLTTTLARDYGLIYRGFVALVANGETYVFYIDAAGEQFGSDTATYGSATTLSELSDYFCNTYETASGAKPYANNELLLHVLTVASGNVTAEETVTSVTYPMSDLITGDDSDNIISDGSTTKGFLDGTDRGTYFFPAGGKNTSVTVTVNAPIAGIYKITGKVAINGSARVDKVAVKNTSGGLPTNWSASEMFGRIETTDSAPTKNASCIVGENAGDTVLAYQYLKKGENTLRIKVESASGKSPLGVASLTFAACGVGNDDERDGSITFAGYNSGTLVEGSDANGVLYKYTSSSSGLSVYGSFTYTAKINVAEAGVYSLNTLFSQRNVSEFPKFKNARLILTNTATGETVVKNFYDDLVNKGDVYDTKNWSVGTISTSSMYADLGTVILPAGSYTLTYENYNLLKSNNTTPNLVINALAFVELIKQKNAVKITDDLGNELDYTGEIDPASPPAIVGHTYRETVTETANGVPTTILVYDRNEVTVRVKFVLSDGTLVEARKNTYRYGDSYSFYASHLDGYYQNFVSGTAKNDTTLVGVYRENTYKTETEVLASAISGGTLTTVDGMLPTVYLTKNTTASFTVSGMQSGAYAIYMKVEGMKQKCDIFYKNLSAKALPGGNWSGIETMGRLQASESSGTTLSVATTTGYRLLGYQYLIDGAENKISFYSNSADMGIAAVKLVKVGEYDAGAAVASYSTSRWAQLGTSTTQHTFTLNIPRDGMYQVSSIIGYQGVFSATVTDSAGNVRVLKSPEDRVQIGTASASVIAFEFDDPILLKAGTATVTLKILSGNYYKLQAFNLMCVGEYMEPVSEREIAVENDPLYNGAFAGGTLIPSTAETLPTLSYAKNATITATFAGMQSGAYAIYGKLSTLSTSGKTDITLRNTSASGLTDANGKSWSNYSTFGRVLGTDTSAEVVTSEKYVLIGYQYFIEGTNTVTMTTSGNSNGGAIGVAALKAVKCYAIGDSEGARVFMSEWNQSSSTSPTKTYTYTLSIPEDGAYDLSAIMGYQVAAEGLCATVTDSLGVTYTYKFGGTLQIGAASNAVVATEIGNALMLKKGTVTLTLTRNGHNYVALRSFMLTKNGEYIQPVTSYKVENLTETVSSSGTISASVTLSGTERDAVVLAAYDANGNLLDFTSATKEGFIEKLSLSLTLSEADRALFADAKVFTVTADELAALLDEATRADALTALAEEIRSGFRYDVKNGLRILVVSDEHYCIDRTTRVGPVTGKTYKTGRINSYTTGHTGYGYGSEERIQLLMDLIKEEHQRGKVDAVMFLGDMTDMDGWYRIIRSNPSAYLSDTNGDGTVDFNDIFKSDYDEMYYVKTEYYDQLQSFDSDGDGVKESSIPVFCSIGNHDVYRHDWFLEVFGYGAEVGVETQVTDNISVYFVNETDYAVIFTQNGKKDTAFFMMNTFKDYDRFVASYEDGSEWTTIKGVWGFSDTLAETEAAIAALDAYVGQECRQIYVGAHYYGGTMFDSYFSKTDRVRGFYIGDAHTQTDTSQQGVPVYIDGCFYETFSDLYNFAFNMAASPNGYMMIETQGDLSRAYRVVAEMSYDITASNTSSYYNQERGKATTDKLFSTDGVYTAMTDKQYCVAMFAYTVSQMTAQNGFALGYFTDGDGNVITLSLDTATGVVTVTDEGGNTVTPAKIYFNAYYTQYVLKGTTVKSGLDKNAFYMYNDGTTIVIGD